MLILWDSFFCTHRMCRAGISSGLQQAGLWFSPPSKWQPVCGLQAMQEHVCPWRNAIHLHMEFTTILMVLRRLQMKSKWHKFRKPAWEKVCTNIVAPFSCKVLKQKNATCSGLYHTWSLCCIQNEQRTRLCDSQHHVQALERIWWGGRAWTATGDAAPVCPPRLCPYGVPSGGRMQAVPSRFPGTRSCWDAHCHSRHKN